MRAISTPGAGKDVVPSWLVNEATVYSKAEFQRSERVNTETRRRDQTTQKGGEKGRGKGKQKGKKKEE